MAENHEKCLVCCIKELGFHPRNKKSFKEVNSMVFFSSPQKLQRVLYRIDN